LIRVGNANDGGYVLPYSLAMRTDFLISFGISEDWSFEIQLKKLNPQVQIHAYDHTISKHISRSSFIHGLLKLPLGMISLEDYLLRYRLFMSYRNFFRTDVRHFRERVNRERELPYDITIEEIFQRVSSKQILLKMDIEGDEYKIIDRLPTSSVNLIGLVAEFHDTEAQRATFVDSVRALQDQFEIVHLHGNNCSQIGRDNLPETLEITFVRKAHSMLHEKKACLPLSLIDAPNNPDKADYKIRFPI